MIVNDYINQTVQQPFEWGVSDCCLFPANWVNIKTGFDPAQEWRGSYHNARGAYHFVRQAGGVLKMVEKSMSPFTMIDVQDAQTGDIGVVSGEFEVDKKRVWKLVAAAIRVGNLWFVRSHRSLVGCNTPYVDILAAWRI